PPTTDTHPLSLHDALPIFENTMSGPFAAPVIPLRPRLGRELGQHVLRLAIPCQHPLETGVQRLRDIRPLFETRKQHRRRLDSGQDRKSTRLNSSHVSISYA